MLLAEELLILLVPRAAGELPRHAGTQSALAAALLVELEGNGRLVVDDDDQVRLVDRAPLGEPALDGALGMIEDGEPVADAVNRLVPGLYVGLLDRLAEQGVLARRARNWVPLASKYVWRVADTARREELGALLASVLSGQCAPDRRSGALISLLHAINAVDQVVTGGEAVQRAEKISDDGWPGRVITYPMAGHAGMDLAPF